MRARTLVMNVGFVAIAATQLWCASDDAPRPPSQDGGSDSGASNDAARSDADAASPSLVCSDDFCRVSLPGLDSVALDALWARNASEVWVAGSTGFAARFDGSSWRRVETGTKAAILGLAATQDGTVWGASSGNEFLQMNRERDGGVETVDGGFEAVIDGISAFGPELYAVGTMTGSFDWPPPPPDHIWRYGPGPDGGAPAWVPVSPPCPMGEVEATCTKFRAVWVESSERQWFAGDEGKIFRTDTSPAGGDDPPGRIRLAEMNSSSLRRLNALWGFNGNDVWAVGVQGVIRHWGGGEAWTVVPSPVTSDLYGVWGSRPDDVWAVGDAGVVIHWDGKSWTVKAIPSLSENRPRFYAVAGTGDDVWVAGEGVLLRSASATGADR